jgi:hypothetical protein
MSGAQLQGVNGCLLDDLGSIPDRTNNLLFTTAAVWFRAYPTSHPMETFPYDVHGLWEK